MSRSIVRQLRVAAKSLRSPVLSTSTRALHSSSRCHTAVASGQTQALHLEDALSRGTNETAKLKQQRYKALHILLSRDNAEPFEVWGRYLELLSVTGPDQVPLETHQLVLRKCTVSPEQSRKDLYARIASGHRSRRGPHPHEVRFQTIISNMRLAGYTPDAEDYHFILEQFAAVGHHIGAMHVLQEMSSLNVKTTHKTYGLCLMALCHRLTLPVWYKQRDLVVASISHVCLQLIDEMWMKRIPMTMFNVDLALRLLKESLDVDTFNKLLRVAYGVDLAYPDRPPLEYWDKDSRASTNDSSSLQYFSAQQPFSTAALNSTLDFLGRSGNVSKLIQAFEVLTTPLPASASSNPESAFADDEDEDFGVNNPLVTSYIAPYAEPNTTTYWLMIKWLCRANHPELARHYLIVAMQHAHQLNLNALKLLKENAQEIPAVQVSITRRMFIPILGVANRDKDARLLRWVRDRMNRAATKKRKELMAFTEVRQKLREDGILSRDDVETTAPPEEEEEEDEEEDMASEDADSSEAEPEEPSSPSGSNVSTADPSTPAPSEPPLKEIPYHPVPEYDPVNEAARVSFRKPLDLNLHIAILKRDKEAIEELALLATDKLGRVVQRQKERLGRRVWAQKDIFLPSEGKRTQVSRDTWRNIVNFKPIRPDIEEFRSRSASTADNDDPQHGYFTPNSWSSRSQEEDISESSENPANAPSTEVDPPVDTPVEPSIAAKSEDAPSPPSKASS